MRHGISDADSYMRDLFRLFHRLNRIYAAFSVNPALYDIGPGNHCNVRPVRAIATTRNLHMATGEFDYAGRRLRIPSISVECDLHGVLAANRPRTAPAPMQLPV